TKCLTSKGRSPPLYLNPKTHAKAQPRSQKNGHPSGAAADSFITLKADMLSSSRTGHAGILSGIRIIEFAGLGPAPFAAMLLADQGAVVIRIDRPGAPVYGDPALDQLNRGKRSILLDLK